MVTVKKNDQKVEEQHWANPTDPGKPGDERDKEKLLRQYKEANRRKNNLTNNNNEQTKN